MSKKSIPASLRRVSWSSPNGSRSGSFEPKGNPQFPPRFNPSTAWESDTPTLAARLFVGFNVGGTPTYSMDHLVEIVRKSLRSQGASEDSSFVYQKGVYTHKDSREVVKEDGAQVIILNTEEGVTQAQFKERVIAVADAIIDQMKQEAVVIEIQKGGVAERVMERIAD